MNKKWAAANKRFAASGGVSRPKISANLQVLYPAQTAVSRRCAKPLGRCASVADRASVLEKVRKN